MAGSGEAFASTGGTRPRVLLEGKPVDSFPEIPPRAMRGTPRRVTEVGEAILATRCQPVTEFGTAELETLLDDMFATQLVASGVGLAANQIDVDLQVFVYDLTDESGVRNVGHICNPVLDPEEAKAGKEITEFEGCLSVPGASEEVTRAERALVRGVNIYGEPVEIRGVGYFARCLQHETDHLNGMLYLDHLSRTRRRMALEEMREEREETMAERSAKTEELAKMQVELQEK